MQSYEVGTSEIQKTQGSPEQLPELFYKKVVLENFAKSTGKHLCQRLFFNKVAGLWPLNKKETLAQVFSFDFCEIFKNTYFEEHLQTAASGPHIEIGRKIKP